MKKHLLSLLALMLCAFSLGFLLGSNRQSLPVHLNTAPTAPKNDRTPQTGTVPTSDEYAVSFPIDLNTADIWELTALPGIGQSLARRIVDYRACYGPFSRPEELLNIDGIGHKTIEAILDYVTTGG